MTTETTQPQPLPRRPESGMRTRAVNAAVGVLLAAMEQGRQLPVSLAIALDSACLLNSPETAAELDRLRGELAKALEQTAAAQVRVAALEARLAEYDQPTDTYPPALPWAALLDADDLEGFLADLVDAASGDDDLSTLTEVESTIARWRAIGEAQHAHNTAPGPNAADEPGMRHAVRTEEAPSPTPMTVYLSTPCDACRHTLNWHRNDVGCTVALCVCGRFQEPTGEAPQDGDE